MVQQFTGMVRVPLAASRSLAVLLLVTHGLCALSLLLLPWPDWVRRALLFFIFISLLRGLRREAWRQSPCAITRVDMEGGGRLRLITRNGQRSLALLLPGSFAAPYGVILRYRRVGAAACTCVVAHDATNAHSHRILRVLLRHPL